MSAYIPTFLSNYQPVGQVVKQSDVYIGMTSQFVNYSDALIPGSVFLLGALGAGVTAYRAKSYKAKAFAAAIALATGLYGAINIYSFIKFAQCFGTNIKSCDQSSRCREIMAINPKTRYGDYFLAEVGYPQKAISTFHCA